MRTLTLDTPRVFVPLLEATRYQGAWGGRGSGKSHYFAEQLIEQCLLTKGTRAVSIREVQKTLKESSKRLIEDKLQAYRLNEADGFKVFNEVIQTPGDGIISFQGMQDHNAESIKSLEGYRIAWVEEAQSLSHRSLSLLKPTIREEGSQLWFSWNPRRKTDAVDVMLRNGELPTGAVVIQANWRDNPKFPSVLEQERQDCLRLTPEQYDHIWEGGYATVLEGAYFAKALADAKSEGRIGRVAADPLMTIRLFADIGGTGAKADNFVFWAGQFISKEIRVLNHYERQGQPLASHINWMRSQGYTPDKAQIWLPHDGDTQDKVYDVSYRSALEQAGYTVTVVPNQGKGAAMLRVESARRLFPSLWFNAETTQAGIEALGWYHERKDEARNIGLGPEHDWCFAAGTQVLTSDGWVSINNITVHNKVVTPCGNRCIIRSGIVRMTDKWITTKGIRSTPEHRFFTKRGLVTAENLRSTDEFWTRDDWGLRILGSLCAMFRSGFMGAITSATQNAANEERQFSYIVWCMRLFMGEFRQATKFITSTKTHSTIIQKTWKLCQSLSIVANTRQSLAFSACAGFAGRRLDAINRSVVDVALPVSGQTAQGSNARGEPAYSLTVDRDECYFVRGGDGRAYLVANSSHSSDAFGLMCVAYEEPIVKRKSTVDRSIGWMG